MSGHTPGPWATFEIEDSRTRRPLVGVTVDNGPADVAHCSGFDSQRGADEERANARLIAAAPDLLAACERALSWLSSYPGGCATSAYLQASAAVDKATRATA